MKEMTVAAERENLPLVTAFINEILNENNCPSMTRIQLDVATDEIFSNIAKYAYDGKEGQVCVQIDIQEDPKAVVIRFSDRGKSFNPLAISDPDTTLPLIKRPIGGLGIYMLKKTMDKVQYERRDGQNTILIRKKL